MASEWSPRLALSHRWGRKLRRALARLLRSPPSRTTSPGVDHRGVAVERRLSTPGVDSTTAATGRPCTAAAAAAATPTAAIADRMIAWFAAACDGVLAWLAAWAEHLEAADAPLAECLRLPERLRKTRDPPTPQGYVGIDARRRHDARVKKLLLPIAEQLAACFGLQRAQRDDI